MLFKKKGLVNLHMNFPFFSDLGYNENVAIGRRKKALVHIAKEDLRLDKESYRQILKGVAGVESSTQLNREGFKKVMNRFQDMGFKGLLPPILTIPPQKAGSSLQTAHRARNRSPRARTILFLIFWKS